jgi:hypothetical protein
LAQWREKNAVLELQSSDLQWLEKLRDSLSIFLRDYCSSWTGVLERSEVGDCWRWLVVVNGLLLDVGLDGVVAGHFKGSSD